MPGRPPHPMQPLRDVLAPGLDLLLVGINPSLHSFAVGHQFARPGNRFWPALHRAGITPERLAPERDVELVVHGVGITNLAPRPTRTAAEVDDDELHAGLLALHELVTTYQPGLVAFVGLTAYRIVFARRRAAVGPGEPHETVGGRPTWVLPNPSGLNAHHQVDALGRLYGEAHRAALALRPAA